VAVFGLGALAAGAAQPVAARAVGPRSTARGALRFGLHASVVATAVALLAFAWSLAVVPTTRRQGLLRDPLLGRRPRAAVHLDAADAGGLAVAGQASAARVPLSPRVVLLLFALALARVFVTPLAYLMHDGEHRRAPRHAHLGHALRRRRGDRAAGAGGGAGAAPGSQTGRGRKPLRAALLSSMLLFAPAA
jgi:cytochrome c oxidase subunit 1